MKNANLTDHNLSDSTLAYTRVSDYLSFFIRFEFFDCIQLIITDSLSLVDTSIGARGYKAKNSVL